MYVFEAVLIPERHLSAYFPERIASLVYLHFIPGVLFCLVSWWRGEEGGEGWYERILMNASLH